MAELVVDEFGMKFHSMYLSHLGYGSHVYYFTKLPYVNGMKFQGDEKQGMILIQDEGMDFQPS